MIRSILAAAVLALAGTAFSEDSGVLRGSPDDGTTKKILKTAADGSLSMVFIGTMTLANETDPQVGDGLPANAVPRWDSTAGALLTGSVFDTGSNVGIGTASPSQKLEVVGTVKATAFQGDGSALTGIGTGLGGSGTAGTVSKWTGASSLGNSVILESAGGNIGIGTASPSQKLEVVGTVKATAFQGDGSGLTGLPSGSQWTTSASDIYYNGGNVGIGTVSPSAKLEVAGQVKITGGSPSVGKVLTSDGGGLATWTSPFGPAFRAYFSGDQSFPHQVHTRIQFNSEQFDTDGAYDPSTSRFTPQRPGRYLVTAQVFTLDYPLSTGVSHVLAIRRNGGDVGFSNNTVYDTYGPRDTVTLTTIVEMNGSTNYLDASWYHETPPGVARNLSGTPSQCFFEAHWIGP